MRTATHRVTLTIVLDVEATAPTIGPEALAMAHHRAEDMAMRVLLHGDNGGAIALTDGPGVGAGVPATVTRVTTVPGTMTVRKKGRR